MEIDLKLWYLKNLNIFKEISEEEMKYIERTSIMKEFEKGRYIFIGPSESSKIFLIKKGMLELGYSEERGKEFIIDILGPNDFFGALSIGSGSESFIKPIDDTLVCIIEQNDFLILLKKYPEVALKIIKSQGSRIKFLEDRIQDIIFKDVKKRICSILYVFHQKMGGKEIPLTHQDIASMAGCARETASLFLSYLKKENVIDYGKKNIKIINPEFLKKFA